MQLLGGAGLRAGVVGALPHLEPALHLRLPRSGGGPSAGRAEALSRCSCRRPGTNLWRGLRGLCSPSPPVPQLQTRAEGLRRGAPGCGPALAHGVRNEKGTYAPRTLEARGAGGTVPRPAARSSCSGEAKARGGARRGAALRVVNRGPALGSQVRSLDRSSLAGCGMGGGRLPHQHRWPWALSTPLPYPVQAPQSPPWTPLFSIQQPGSLLQLPKKWAGLGAARSCCF